MQPLGLNEIRERFLSFFEEKDHLRLPSFSLVPRNDPSILLINAGMTPLKPYFTGAQTPPAPRVTTCQKCIRTPDIERVGLTSRHGTFFEMLGNFSFGDYFKEEIIPWSWSFCTETLAIPADRLYVSVYEEDDEAWRIWHEAVGLPSDRIVRLGKADNFWEHGTGPCGPSSEIYYDRGPEHGCGSPTCAVGCDCDRFVEFWNLVFTQFNREEDGSYTQLDRRNIDTGAGLERLAAIMQGVDSLFEVDTIRSILDRVCQIAKVAYGQDPRTDIAVRVITDHVRSTTMMISDGIIPANEGRGYVLRRLLRRAARYGRLLGIEGPFLDGAADVVIAASESAYPDLRSRRDYILKIIQIEEQRFSETIQQGLGMLEQLIADARQKKAASLPGEAVFKLHDTFGFPLDLTREIAAEQGIDIDEQGFQDAMRQQKEKARQAMKDKNGSAWHQRQLPDGLEQIAATEFVGYDTLETEAMVLALLRADENGQLEVVDSVNAGESIQILTDRSPFYAEAGGQTGDQGLISAADAVLQVTDTQKTPEGQILHIARMISGHLSIGETIDLRVDRERRLATARNHTATHILHKALRQVLGDHVGQAGSSVSPERLRFDFTHFQPLTDDEVLQIEAIVNHVILDSQPVETRIMSLDEAKTDGATALFDEKYGDQVRVVSVGAFSRELCGGTHLTRSSEACLFQITAENGIAAGVRRIEALTGRAAWELQRQRGLRIQQAADLLKTTEEEIPARLEHLLAENRQLNRALEQEQKQQIGAIADQLVSQAQTLGDFKVTIAELPGADAQQLREACERIRDKSAPSIVVLASRSEDKAAWAAMASREAVNSGFHAGNLVREVAKITGGGGGGRPDMAQAGGRQPENIPKALAAAAELIKQQLRL